MEDLSMLNYYDNKEYISNSALGWLKRSPVDFLANLNGDFERKESLSLSRGSLLHTYILEPEKFIVEDVEPISGMMGNFVKKLSELKNNNNSVEFSSLSEEEMKLQAYNFAGFRQSQETVFKNFEKDDVQKYYQFLLSANGKIAISATDKFIIERCTQSLTDNNLTFDLLFGQNPEMEIYNEHEIYTEGANGFKAKGKIDRLLINRKDNYAIVVDLKTTSSSCYGGLYKVADTGNTEIDYRGTGFLASYINYNYYRQMAYYASLVIKKFGVENVECFIIPVETSGLFNCCVYKQSKTMLLAGVDEYSRLIDTYMWHKNNNQWTVPIGFEEGYKII